MQTFSARAWDETSALRQEILDLPFNRELTDGTLSEERFRFYMIQDALYLEGFSRALAIAAAKAPDARIMQRFMRSAEEALVDERMLHNSFFEKFGIEPDEAVHADPSPTCYAYVNFLLTTAHQGSYGELVAAVLPCLWVYWEVGNHIANRAIDNNPYQAWIDTYSDADFGKAVEAAIAISDRLFIELSPIQQDAMVRVFKRSTLYEWMFWDSAFRLEKWPLEV